MRIRRKADQCLNCGSTLGDVYNFCPACGQENNHNNISFGKLFKDFFGNYFSLDTRFGHSIKPFFIQPGYLTERFNEGKRMAFVNPIRLYLVLSLFYFFVFSFLSRDEFRDDKTKPINLSGILVPIDDIPDSTRRQINKILDNQSIKRLNETMDSKDIEGFTDALNDDDIQELRKNLPEDVLKQFGLEPFPGSDSIIAEKEIPVDTSDPEESNEESIFSKIDWVLFQDLVDNNELSDQEIYDSLNVGEVSFLEDKFTRQIIRIQRADGESVAGYIIKNMPIMMFLLLPIFALLLKLLYIRRTTLYIRHLVHALHLHSFAYFIYGWALLAMIFLLGETGGVIIGVVSFILVSTYAYLSFLRVYKQHWFKTFIKFNLLGLVYGISLLIFFITEMIVSLILF